MTHVIPPKTSLITVVVVGFLVAASTSRAQDPRVPSPRLPDIPRILDTNAGKIRVVPIKGLRFPWAMAFLPDGNILVTEKGRSSLRMVRNGVVDPTPITGLPPVFNGTGARGGLDVALHPRFLENKLVYFAYWKPKPDNENLYTAALGRGRFDGGTALTDVRELFVSNSWSDMPIAVRIAFDREGKIFMVIGADGLAKTLGKSAWAQDPAEDAGKVLRLNDDGSVPQDNPFVGKAGYRPEIYALGIRNALGLIVHPETGELWETENGPQGGDEVNIIKRGANYGWPVITYGHAYISDADGSRSGLPPPNIQPPTSAPGMEQPVVYYVPSIATSGMVFYTGDKFPVWKGNLFVGGLRGQMISRIIFNKQGLEAGRYPLLTELRQRIRDVRQGPDGYLYLSTDEEDGAILRLEPVPADPQPQP